MKEKGMIGWVDRRMDGQTDADTDPKKDGTKEMSLSVKHYFA